MEENSRIQYYTENSEGVTCLKNFDASFQLDQLDRIERKLDKILSTFEERGKY
ncbi:hypothetical protein J14TS2_45110 [Bacillus sp. J14TS2]|uniref:hypothetical protein n=1 Tax=Bacillus sp. J14TS2 TaxID=2807188 RepID=UPI001B2402BA|nr:hypothetical protein [Bacillus sp. J14TS2]GIN74036.1 hypothetical protein J14TS2_45110 [Bacillus sp. J14TS2]